MKTSLSTLYEFLRKFVNASFDSMFCTFIFSATFFCLPHFHYTSTPKKSDNYFICIIRTFFLFSFVFFLFLAASVNLANGYSMNGLADVAMDLMAISNSTMN